MKKFNITKKGKVIGVIVSVFVLVIAVVIGINTYRTHEKQEQIRNCEKQISQVQENFSKEKEHIEKLDSLKSFIKDYEQYKKSDKAINEITVKYEKGIETMKHYFTDVYDKTLADNTLEKVDEITDKNKILTTKTNLETLLKTIEDETSIVCTEKEAKVYSQSVKKIIASYDTRIKAIEQKEAEEAAAKKAAEEAEAKRIAEEAAQAAQEAQASSSGDSSGSNYYGGGSSDSGSSSSGSGSGYYDGGSSDSGSSDSGSSDSSSGNDIHFYDKDGNDVTPPDYDPNDPVWY